MTILVKIVNFTHKINENTKIANRRLGLGPRSRDRFNIFDWPDWPHDRVMFICLSNLVFQFFRSVFSVSRSFSPSGSVIKPAELKDYYAERPPRVCLRVLIAEIMLSSLLWWVLAFLELPVSRSIFTTKVTPCSGLVFNFRIAIDFVLKSL
ncbi:hypothetical protein GLOIN_2v1480856 [Rhizophagus irregularis DAOM 181602=DAOM 197198]|uniref:Uncharacterized protein n=1 Tax=Rhizophagus irregularis (strain DAOM 181602 / DAOM 197198 / MUCL 43194) TaxID=747089 RepID=A0A2P4PSI9_RHIID|nr:hypothetical protein GLOIN_2v1480856 [Rhizophagus irregularis DAOM 181602=DAOM 197198]POG68353.1 hypothetical protein GLOIN_2v1480856 [Rhizophagus irregularis DAOM 181602=DAOM 197198]|eukprot:XP_025175219.1 hypothetical protein GLOIN_2v1480856 [Rhizophagus irregularis DAOM 181602=DAOM 197198]